MDAALIRRGYESVVGVLEAGPLTDALLASVGAALERARAQGSVPVIDVCRFAARVAKIAGAGVDAVEEISDLHAGDLALAVAALAGSRDAVQIIDDLITSTVRPVLHLRLGSSSPKIEEVMQQVRVRVLVGEERQPARLPQYRANGKLSAWLRVIAVRIAYDLIAEDKPIVDGEAQLDHALVQVALTQINEPELRELVVRSAPLLARAMEDAIKTLRQKDRYLLRVSLVDHLSIDDIGAIYGKDRSTAARWVNLAKSRLAEATEEAYCSLAKATESEFHSVRRALPGYFDASLVRMLSDVDADADADPDAHVAAAGKKSQSSRATS